MAKEKETNGQNNDLQNTTQKTKDRAILTIGQPTNNTNTGVVQMILQLFLSNCCIIFCFERNNGLLAVYYDSGKSQHCPKSSIPESFCLYCLEKVNLNEPWLDDSFDADGVGTKTSDDIEPESVSSSDITSGLSIAEMAVTVFIGFDSEFCFISNKVFLIMGANVFLRPDFAFPIKVSNSPDINRLSTSVCFGAGP